MNNYRNPINRLNEFDSPAGNTLKELRDAELDTYSGGCSSNGSICSLTVECTQITNIGGVAICCG